MGEIKRDNKGIKTSFFFPFRYTDINHCDLSPFLELMIVPCRLISLYFSAFLYPTSQSSPYLIRDICISVNSYLFFFLIYFRLHLHLFLSLFSTPSILHIFYLLIAKPIERLLIYSFIHPLSFQLCQQLCRTYLSYRYRDI